MKIRITRAPPGLDPELGAGLVGLAVHTARADEIEAIRRHKWHQGGSSRKVLKRAYIVPRANLVTALRLADRDPLIGLVSHTTFENIAVPRSCAKEVKPIPNA